LVGHERETKELIILAVLPASAKLDTSNKLGAESSRFVLNTASISRISRV